MGIIKLSQELYSVGVLNPTLRTFDIIMTADYGTSYNAYLLKGEKNILIDTVKEDFCDEYFENINQVADIKQVNYLIVNHTEPDHSGSIKKLLEINPDITVICTLAAQKYLCAIVNQSFKCQTVKHGDVLELNGYTLKFIVAPFLHWPDTMMVYYEKADTLFSCDFLGAHYCEPRMLEKHVMYPDIYRQTFKYYYDCIFGPFKPFVLAGLEKLKGLDIQTICTSHGPILQEQIPDAMKLYAQWSQPKATGGQKKVTIIYASAYGYTGELAKAAYAELKDDYDASILDIVTTPMADLSEAIEQCDALLVGSCTINKDAPKPVWEMLSSIDAINTGKPAGVFGDFGWSGEAPAMIKERLKGLKFKTQDNLIKVNFMPTEKDLEEMKMYARDVVSQIKA